MIKRLLGAVALGVGLALVPVTVHFSNHAKAPTLAVSEACAATSQCCPFAGSFCVQGGHIYAGMRPYDGESCPKPGT